MRASRSSSDSPQPPVGGRERSEWRENMQSICRALFVHFATNGINWTEISTMTAWALRHGRVLGDHAVGPLANPLPISHPREDAVDDNYLTRRGPRRTAIMGDR